MIGSDETHDRQIRFCFHQEIGATNTVHLFGLRPETTPPFHAFRDRRIMATPAEDSERHHTLDHGLKISRIRECVECIPSSLSPHSSIQDKDFVFEDPVKDFNLIFSAVKTGRSLAASYSLQNDIQRKHPMGPLFPSSCHRYLMDSSAPPGSIGPRSQTVRIASTHDCYID